MNLTEFTSLLEKTIDASRGSIKPGQPLADIIEWDSVAVLSFIAMVDEKFGKQISGRDISGCTTVTDLAGLLGDSISG